MEILRDHKKVDYIDGKRITEEEYFAIIPKGLMIKYYFTDGITKKKIVILSKDTNYEMSVNNNNNETKTMLDKNKLMDELLSRKELHFAAKLMAVANKKITGAIEGGAKRGRSRSRSRSKSKERTKPKKGNSKDKKVVKK